MECRAVVSSLVSIEVDLDEDERTVPIVALDHAHMVQEGADMFPIFLARDPKVGFTAAACCESKGPNG